MLSPLRGWRIAVQYHFLNGHSSCGDAVVCRVEQFSTPKKRNFKKRERGTINLNSVLRSRFGLPKTNAQRQKHNSKTYVGLLPEIHSLELASYNDLPQTLIPVTTQFTQTNGASARRLTSPRAKRKTTTHRPLIPFWASFLKLLRLISTSGRSDSWSIFLVNLVVF